MQTAPRNQRATVAIVRCRTLSEAAAAARCTDAVTARHPKGLHCMPRRRRKRATTARRRALPSTASPREQRPSSWPPEHARNCERADPAGGIRAQGRTAATAAAKPHRRRKRIHMLPDCGRPDPAAGHGKQLKGAESDDRRPAGHHRCHRAKPSERGATGREGEMSPVAAILASIPDFRRHAQAAARKGREERRRAVAALLVCPSRPQRATRGQKKSCAYI